MIFFDNTDGASDWRIKRIEQKLDLILKHLGIEYEDTTESNVRDLLKAGQKIQAIKEFREQTGASLKEAKEAVEAIAKDMHNSIR